MIEQMFLSLDDEAFKKMSRISSSSFSFFIALTLLLASLYSSFSFSASFSNKVDMSKVFRSCDSLMAVTLCSHFLHIDLNILLAQFWLDKYLPKVYSLLIKLRKCICKDSKVSPGSMRKVLQQKAHLTSDAKWIVHRLPR